MPSNVRTFAVLCYLSLVIGIFQAVLSFDDSVTAAAHLGGARFVLIVDIGVVAFLALIFWLVAFRRQNWARWLLLVMCVIGLPLTIMTFSALLQSAPTQAAVSIFQTVMQIVALYLVFTGNAKAWFCKEKALTQ
jgi:hypothetical protein